MSQLIKNQMESGEDDTTELSLGICVQWEYQQHTQTKLRDQQLNIYQSFKTTTTHQTKKFQIIFTFFPFRERKKLKKELKIMGFEPPVNLFWLTCWSILLLWRPKNLILLKFRTFPHILTHTMWKSIKSWAVNCLHWFCVV